MEVENGTWIMRGVDWDDPNCIHTAEELLIAQKSLNNFFSRCGDEPKVYRNSVCEIRKGELYTKSSNRGRKKES